MAAQGLTDSARTPRRYHGVATDDAKRRAGRTVASARDQPAKNPAGRDKQVIFYVLWDWADGKLWEGWRK